MTYNLKTDAYISKAPEFAKPILEYFRAAMHKGSPLITESIKWSVPSFDYNGKMMCSMAAFKNHCAIGFWLGGSIKALKGYYNSDADSGSEFWRLSNITSLTQMPKEKQLIAAVKEAIALIEMGVTMKRTPAKKTTVPPVPVEFAKALAKNKKANIVFEKASPSFRKEYIQWITEAKTAATREKRIAAALEWIAEGKGRNWKYERK